MVEPSNPLHKTPAIAAACIFMVTASSGHYLVAIVAAAAVYVGLRYRQRPERRSSGTALMIAAALSASVAVVSGCMSSI